MVSVALAALPAYGHVYPLMPLAQALAGAGADVHVAVGEPFLARLPLPTRAGIDPAEGLTLSAMEREVTAEYPQVREDRRTRWPVTFFGVTNPRHVAPALRRAWREDRPDLVVHEMYDVAASIVAAELDIPSVALGISQYSPMWFGVLEVAREALGPGGLAGRMPWDVAAAAADEAPPGWRYLDLLPAALQSTSQEQITGWAPLRSVAWSEPSVSSEPPLGPKGGRPRVFITLGTVAFGATEALRTAVLAATSTGAEVVVACGPEADVSALADLPDGVLLRRFLPLADLLPTVDLVVHHGGTGTMLAAAEHGIPQVVLPQGADQFLNGAQIASAGVGWTFVGEAQTREAVATAVEEGLAEGPVRAAARAVQGDIARMPSPASVAQDLLAGL